MQRSLSSIFAIGVLAAIFMVIMSAFYLRQLPTEADLRAVEPQIRQQHGIYLSTGAPVELKLLRAKQDGEGIGIRLRCVLRPDIRRHEKSVSLHLRRMARTVLDSPELKGRINYVCCQHMVKPILERVVVADPTEEPAQQASSAR